MALCLFINDILFMFLFSASNKPEDRCKNNNILKCDGSYGLTNIIFVSIVTLIIIYNLDKTCKQN